MLFEPRWNRYFRSFFRRHFNRGSIQVCVRRTATITASFQLKCSLQSAPIEASPRYFLLHATNARAAMAMIRDASELLARLLEGGHSMIAGRLASAVRNSGCGAIAVEIMRAMSAAGYAL